MYNGRGVALINKENENYKSDVLMITVLHIFDSLIVCYLFITQTATLKLKHVLTITGSISF